MHLLSEDRGASLEAGVVGRIKLISKLREMQDKPIGSVRWVAVSATIPNTADLATWLGVSRQGIKTFGGCFRRAPCLLACKLAMRQAEGCQCLVRQAADELTTHAACCYDTRPSSHRASPPCLQTRTCAPSSCAPW